MGQGRADRQHRAAITEALIWQLGLRRTLWSRTCVPAASPIGTDVPRRRSHVRYRGQSGTSFALRELFRFFASGPPPRGCQTSLDDLVGLREHFGWDGYAKLPGGLKVDHAPATRQP